MRTMDPSLATIARPGSGERAGSGEGAAVSEGQHEPDEGGDQAGDDDYPLLAGRGDHLYVEADHERGQPEPGREDVPGNNEAEREGQHPRDEREDGEAVLQRVPLAVGVQRDRETRAGTGPGGLRHRPPPFLLRRQVSGNVPARAGPESCARVSEGSW